MCHVISYIKMQLPENIMINHQTKVSELLN